MAEIAKNIDVPISSVVGQMTIGVRVRGMGAFRFRLAIVRVLLWVISWISPIQVETSVVDD